MKELLQFLNESLVLGIALISGIVAFRRMNGFARIIFFQLLTWIVFFCGSYLITSWQIKKGLAPNNQALFNIHLVIETTLLMISTLYILKERYQKLLVRLSLLLFLIVFIVQALLHGVGSYLYYADTAACFLLSLIFGLALFHLFTNSSAWWRSPEIYICSGILIYYTCSIPYITSFGYLQENYPEMSQALFHLVNDVLANTRYLLVTIGFWLMKGVNHE